MKRLGVNVGEGSPPVVRGQYKINNADTPRAVLLSVPWEDVFSAITRHRAGLVTWLESLEGVKVVTADGPLPEKFDAVDVLLSRTNSITFREQKCKLQKWTSLRTSKVSKNRMMCERIIESPHPYPNNTEIYTHVSFPGASMITLTFDPRTSLEGELFDYFEFFKDESLTTRYGARFSGKGLRGSCTIASDSFIFHFKSDRSINGWGFLIKLSASINNDLRDQIFNDGWDGVLQRSAKQARGETKINPDHISTFNRLTIDAIEKSLVVAWNHDDVACDWLLEHRFSLTDEVQGGDDSKNSSSFVEQRGLYRTGMCSIFVLLYVFF